MRDKSRLGRPTEALTSTMAANIEILSTKIAVTLQGVANQFIIGKASAHQIYTQKIGMSKASRNR